MSEKKVLAFSLLGVVINQDPWKKVHEIGMKELAEKANMPELLDKVGKHDYFKSVEEALSKIDEYKDLKSEERLDKRRELYFDRVLKIFDEGDYIDFEFVSFLRGLKENYRLMLISTNPLSFVGKVLDRANADSLFDDLACLEMRDIDDKRLAFERASEKFHKPDIFIGSKKSEEICKEFEIKFIEYHDVEQLKEDLEDE